MPVSQCDSIIIYNNKSWEKPIQKYLANDIFSFTFFHDSDDTLGMYRVCAWVLEFRVTDTIGESPSHFVLMTAHGFINVKILSPLRDADELVGWQLSLTTTLCVV